MPCVTHLHQELQHTMYYCACSCVHQFLFYELVIRPIFIEHKARFKWESTICWSEKCSAELSIVMGSNPWYWRCSPRKNKAAFPAASASTQHLHAKSEHSSTPHSNMAHSRNFFNLLIIHNPPNFFWVFPCNALKQSLRRWHRSFPKFLWNRSLLNINQNIGIIPIFGSKISATSQPQRKQSRHRGWQLKDTSRFTFEVTSKTPITENSHHACVAGSLWDMESPEQPSAQQEWAVVRVTEIKTGCW